MRVRRTTLLAAAALAALGSVAPLVPMTAQPSGDASASTEPWLMTVARSGGYVAEIRFDTVRDEQIATLRREGAREVLWTHRGLRLNFGPGTPDYAPHLRGPDGLDPVPAGAIRDLTGDGVPELMVREWTGGAHCCFTLFVLSLGATLQVLDTVPLEHSDDVEVADLDGDGRAEIRATEWVFAYWNESFAGSPRPAVTLSLTDEGYRIAPALQRRPALKADELARRVAEIRTAWTEPRPFPPTELWDAMLDLIYRGQAQQVPALLDCAWPGDALGRNVFNQYFADQLYTSPWADEVDALNDGTLYDTFRTAPAACTLPAA